MGRFRLLAVPWLVAAAACSQEVPIHAVQGPGSRSPYEGQWVVVRGVVTGVARNGFFLQGMEPDDDPRTSEGIFVYTGGTPPGVASPGALLRVRGRVEEYVPSGDPAAPPLTELVSPDVTLLSAQTPVPEPAALSTNLPHPGGLMEQLEPLEGMRVRVASLTVTAPTAGRLDEATASATSTGVFFGVVTGLPRPFREPGFPPFDPVPSGNPPRFDGNPEVLRVDTACLVGGAPVDLAVGAVVADLTGPLTVGSRRYTLCPEPGFRIAFQPAVPVPPPPPQAGQLVLASWNIHRFFDDQDDPARSEPVLSSEAFAFRLDKAARAVAQFLYLPQVLVLQEVESERVLTHLALRLGTLARASWGEDPAYEAVLGLPDSGGLRLGALVARGLRGVRVSLLAASSILQGARLTNPDGSSEPLFDRPPLHLTVELTAPGQPRRQVAVVAVHLRSLIGLLSTQPGTNGWPTEGARVRAKRAKQGEELARWVDSFQRQNPTTPLILLGDYNAFEFPDGVVDLLGTVAGAPAPPEAVVLPTQDLLDPDLVVATALEPPAQRYSYVYDGSAQALDHALISRSLLDAGWRWELFRPRIAADFPDSARNQASPYRLSDHDPLLLVLEPPRAPRLVRGPLRR